MNTDSRTLASALALAPDAETRHRLLELAYRKVHLPSPTEFLTGPSYGNMRNLYPNVLRLIELILSPNVHEYYIEIGKGGGKSTIAAACVTYSAARLLALDKPHEFFSLQATKPIVCLTVATSEEQAKRTIFSQVKSMISHNPFFEDRANIRSTDIELDGGKILIICGHSKSEGMEGHDVFFANIDEANKHGGGSPAGKEQVRKLRDTFISSAESRFPFDYKVGCISSSVSMEDFQRQEIEWIRANGRPIDFKTGKVLDVADAGA